MRYSRHSRHRRHTRHERYGNTLNPPAPAATITANEDVTGKVGGDTVAFTTMFTIKNSLVADYTVTISPAEAGSVNASNGVAIAAAYAGDIAVTAKLTADETITATANIVGVTAKP